MPVWPFLRDFWKISDMKFLSCLLLKTNQWFGNPSFSCKFKSWNCKANEYWQKFLLPEVINTFYTKCKFKTIAKNALHFSTHTFHLLFLLTFSTMLSSQRGRDGWMDGWVDDVPFFFFHLLHWLESFHINRFTSVFSSDVYPKLFLYMCS